MDPFHFMFVAPLGKEGKKRDRGVGWLPLVHACMHVSFMKSIFPRFKKNLYAWQAFMHCITRE